MYRFFLQYRYEPEREAYPFPDQDWGVRIEEDTEIPYNYRKTINGKLTFYGDDYIFIASKIKESIIHKFKLRITGIVGVNSVFEFTVRDGEYDEDSQKFILELASENSTLERLKKVWDREGVITTGFVPFEFQAAPIWQIYIAGSRYITNVKNEYWWQEEVSRVYVMQQLLEVNCAFSKVGEVITVSTNWEGAANWHIEFQRVANFTFRPILRSNNVRIEQYIAVNTTIPSYRFRVVDITGNVLFISARQYDPIIIDDVIQQGISEGWVYPINMEFMPTHASTEGKRFMLTSYQIYHRVIGTQLSETEGIRPVRRSANSEDVMPIGEYRSMIRPGREGWHKVSTTTQTKEYVKENKPYYYEAANAVKSDEVARAGRYPYIDDNMVGSIPINPQDMINSLSIWMPWETVLPFTQSLANQGAYTGTCVPIWTVIQQLLNNNGLSDVIFEYATPTNNTGTPFVWNHNLYEMVLIPKTWLTKPGGKQELKLTIKDCLDLVCNMFNGYLHVKDNKINILPFRNVIPQQSRNLSQLTTRRTGRPVEQYLGIKRFDGTEIPRGITYEWGDKVRKVFSGFPIEYDTYQALEGEFIEKTNSKFNPDIERALLMTNEYSDNGAFVYARPFAIDADRINNWLMEIDGRHIRVFNGYFSYFNLQPTYHRDGHPFKIVRINNKDVTGAAIKRMIELDVDFPIRIDWLTDFENNKLITLHGELELKDITIKLNTHYLSGKMRYPHVGDVVIMPPIDPIRYDLLVISTEGGATEGSGQYTSGQIIIITAHPQHLYLFSHWERDGVLYSSDPMVSFTMPENNVTFTAIFSEYPHEVIYKGLVTTLVNIPLDQPLIGEIRFELVRGEEIVEFRLLRGESRDMGPEVHYFVAMSNNAIIINNHFSKELYFMQGDTGIDIGAFYVWTKSPHAQVQIRVTHITDNLGLTITAI